MNRAKKYKMQIYIVFEDSFNLIIHGESTFDKTDMLILQKIMQILILLIVKKTIKKKKKEKKKKKK